MTELLQHLTANVRRLRDVHGMSLSQPGVQPFTFGYRLNPPWTAPPSLG
jgi:hypothetical protein